MTKITPKNWEADSWILKDYIDIENFGSTFFEKIGIFQYILRQSNFILPFDMIEKT